MRAFYQIWAVNLTATAAVIVAAALLVNDVWAQDFWDPFRDRDRSETSQQRRAPAAEPYATGGSPGSTKVERDELDPVMAPGGSGLPLELWQGLDLERLETLIAEVDIPPRSPALSGLWRKLLTSGGQSPSGDGENARFNALRLEVLYRSGITLSSGDGAHGSNDATAAALMARSYLASGQSDKACEAINGQASQTRALPQRLKGETILMSGYCALLAKDTGGAALAAELAREEGIEASPGLAALDAVSVGAKPKVPRGQKLSVIDYRLLQAAGAKPGQDILANSEPALLVAIAGNKDSHADMRLLAVEAAARLNALSVEELASQYRALANAEGGDTLLSSASRSSSGSPVRRATLFTVAERERTPMKKARLIRALVDEAPRAQLTFQVMAILAPLVRALQPAQELSWFAETGAEVLIGAGDYAGARRWTTLPSQSGGQPLQQWLALADLIDPQVAGDRAQPLAVLEDLALRGRFPPDQLHKLATALDALNANVPIPLWDAASRTPQPASGHLPATGILSELQDAAKKRQFGRTVLLVMKTLGPDGPQGAHMIALGDSIRALKRAGLDTEARRIALEALFAAWPRTQVN